MMEKMKIENEMKNFKHTNATTVTDDSKAEIIEIPTFNVNPDVPPTKPIKPSVELDSSNQEEEADNVALSERRGRRKHSRQPYKKEIKPLESSKENIEKAIDLSVSEKEEVKPRETQVKTEEKLKGRKTRRSHKTEEEEIKP